MKKNLLALIILAALTLSFAGCGSVGQLVALDEGVKKSVTYNELHDTRLPDGRMEVAARLRNRENRRIQVQVNCQFKDDNGLTLDATPFENVILTENSEEVVKFTSMNDKPTRYTIRVREAR